MEKSTSNKIYVVSEFVDRKSNSAGYFWFKIIYGLSLKLTNINVLSSPESCQLAMDDNDTVTYINTAKSISPIGNGFIVKLIYDIFLSSQFALKAMRKEK